MSLGGQCMGAARVATACVPAAVRVDSATSDRMLPSGVLRSLLLWCLSGCAPHPVTVSGLWAASNLDALDVQGATGAWSAGDARDLVPVGRYLRADNDVGYSYVDATEGLSVRWDEPVGGPGSIHIRRLSWMPAGASVLSEHERRALGLPEVPAWFGSYGPQPAAGALYGTWRTDPSLAHRFHPEYPDDLRVVIGEVRATGEPWVEAV